MEAVHNTTGHIERIESTIQYTHNQYRTFWVRTQEDNPQSIRMQMSGTRCDILDDYSQDDLIKVNFSISGQPRERNGELELFNNINAIFIEKI